MIITKTPTRVSLLGGGSDYSLWSTQHGGFVVGGAINKFSVITARYLPPFHDFKHRLIYRDIEHVNDVGELQHRAAQACIRHLGLGQVGLEISHLADLPGRSGTGSSSTFVVGLLHALSALSGRLMLPYYLAQAAIDIEQKVLGETVGCQDQVFAAHGGLNVLHIRQDGEISVRPLPIDASHVRELEEHLLLFFTKMPRTSSDVAASYVPSLAQKERDMFAMMKLAHEGVDAIMHRKWERLGKLIDQSWRIKSGLSDKVSNEVIASMYVDARLAGAWGGKITGAGGGGCLLLVAPQEKRQSIIAALHEAVHIPFRFEFSGSSIIFSDRENLREYRPA